MANLKISELGLGTTPLAGDELVAVVQAGATVRVCRTCAQNRGLLELPLLPGTAIGNLTELTDWIMAADKVLTF